MFLSVNFRGILPMEIFPRYIPKELRWEKKLKQSKKNDDVLIFNYPSVNPSLTRPNKKPESLYFTRDRLISSSSTSSSSSSSTFSSSLYVKNINIYFFLFFSLLISFSFPPCSGMSSSSFFFYPLSFFFKINMFYEIFSLSLASLATTLR